MDQTIINQRKRVIVFLICLIVIVIVSLLVIALNKEDNKVPEISNTRNLNYIQKSDLSKENISNKVKKKQTVKQFEISNTKIVYENGMSKLTAEIFNNSEYINKVTFKVTFIELVSNIIIEKEISLDNIKANEKRNILLTFEEDVSNIDSIKYELI
jgi:ABC-type uncharacterized transport system permease subunit